MQAADVCFPFAGPTSKHIKSVERHARIPHMAVGQHQYYHFGVGAPPSLVYFSGDWDVHWGYGILTHGHMSLFCLLFTQATLWPFQECCVLFWPCALQKRPHGMVVIGEPGSAQLPRRLTWNPTPSVATASASRGLFCRTPSWVPSLNPQGSSSPTKSEPEQNMGRATYLGK